MEILVIIVGLIVTIGTPVGTYLATLKGHQVALANAAASNETTREEHGRTHFRYACDKVASSDPRQAAVGVAILKSMLLDGNLNHDDLVAVAGVLDVVTSPASLRVGDRTPVTLADPAAGGEGGASGETEQKAV